jgi:hypothetical protein
MSARREPRIVLAAGVDAFAAAVDQVGGAGLARRAHREEAGQPCGEVAAGHVAVAGEPGPARGEPHADQVAAAQLGSVHRFLEIQQTKVVLAALADHGLLRPQLRVGIDRVALALDLALQGAGVGRNPDRRPVGLGP